GIREVAHRRARLGSDRRIIRARLPAALKRSILRDTPTSEGPALVGRCSSRPGADRMRARLTTLIALVALVAASAGSLHAQTYPSRSLRIVVPFAPGGSTDIFARLIGERLAAGLGQPVVIDNRPGAGGNIGAEMVAKSAPDGYTLLMATTGVMAINNALYRNMSFDAAKDLEPVIFIASITNALVVPA